MIRRAGEDADERRGRRGLTSSRGAARTLSKALAPRPARTRSAGRRRSRPPRARSARTPRRPRPAGPTPTGPPGATADGEVQGPAGPLLVELDELVHGEGRPQAAAQLGDEPLGHPVEGGRCSGRAAASRRSPSRHCWIAFSNGTRPRLATAWRRPSASLGQALDDVRRARRAAPCRAGGPPARASRGSAAPGAVRAAARSHA